MSGNDELLIELVKNYPVLYNLQHKDYHNNQIKDNAWKEIAAMLDKNVAETKTKWKTIRDTYKRHLNKIKNAPTGSSASSSSKYSKYNLEFLNESFKHRSTVSNMPSDTSEKEALDPDDTQDEEDKTINQENVNNQGDKNTTQQCKKRKADMLAEELKRNREQRQEMVTMLQNRRKGHPVEQFFQGIAATVMTFPPELVVKAKLAVTQLIANIELEALRSQNENRTLSTVPVPSTTGSGTYDEEPFSFIHL